jgi:hypothetical protein
MEHRIQWISLVGSALISAAILLLGFAKGLHSAPFSNAKSTGAGAALFLVALPVLASAKARDLKPRRAFRVVAVVAALLVALLGLT